MTTATQVPLTTRVADRLADLPRASEIAIGLLFVASFVVARGQSGSALVTGLVVAAPLVLNAIGMVLVYRANRFINFAQLQIGIFAVIVFDGLVRGRAMVLALHGICSGCATATPGGAADTINLILAGVLSLVFAACISVLLYIIVLRRFASSPILVPTIVTMFLAQALNGAQAKVTEKLVSADNVKRGTALPVIDPPVDHVWTVAGTPIHLAQAILVLLGPVLLVGVAAYLRTSDTGVAIRAAAENPQRAATLGVDVADVTSRVWVVAGLLSGVAALIPAVFQGVVAASSAKAVIPVGDLVVLLTALVLARFTSIWIAAAAMVALTTLQSAVQLSNGSTAALDAAFVLIVGVLLFLQSDRQTRAMREDSSGLDVARELRGIPVELRHLDSVRLYVRGARVVALVALLGLPWTLSISQTALLVDSFVFVIVGFSILVLTGWAGQVSFGQFGFAAIGAWAAAASGAPFVIALALAGAAGAIAALVVGLPAMRLRGLSLAITTLAFAVSAQVFFLDPRFLGAKLPDSLSAPEFFGLDLGEEKAFYYLTLGFVAAACAMVIGLRRSRTGRVLIALRSNEAAAQSFGIDPRRARLTAFATSGAMSAVAGALLGYHLGAVPQEAFTADQSLTVFLYTVVGGLGGIAGPIVGMGLYALIVFFAADSPLVQYFGAGMGAVFLMMVAPGGLAQLVYGLRDAMLRRIAVRLRIPVPSLMGDKGALMTQDRAPLDEKREAPRRPGDLMPLRYKPAGQWALARYGEADVTKERVGG